MKTKTQKTQTSGARIFGYARVSTTDQDLSIQQAALEAAGCLKIFAEKKSGTRSRRSHRAAGAPRMRPRR
jgi:DNA invertase Pin-like site-specific DNA recombinase